MMPKFILYIAISLDGYVAKLDGSIDWLASPETEGEDYGYSEFYHSIDALVMGSATYEQVVGFGEWVYAGKPSYVLTQRNLSTTRDDVFFVQNGVEEVLKTLTEQHHQRVWIVGGGKIASLFIQQELVDEYILFVMPTLLGSGLPLFQSVPELKLDLVGLDSYDSGVAKLHYKKKSRSSIA